MQYNQYHIQFIQNLKLLPKHGQKKEEEAAELTLNSIKKLFDTFTDSAGLNRTIKAFNDFATIAADIANTFDILEDRAKLFNEQLGIGSKTSIKYALALDEVAISLDRHAAGFKRAQVESAKYYKGTAQYHKKYSTNLKDGNIAINTMIASMREEFKLSEDQAQSFRKNALSSGIRSDAWYEQVLVLGSAAQEAGVYDGAIQDLLKTFGDISPDLLARYTSFFGAGNDKEAIRSLSTTALKVNQMGMDFKQIEQSSKGFLDLQKKAADQMLLQEITGKQILTHSGENYTQAIQQAYINNDANRQFELQRDLILDNAEEISKNVFTAEKYANYMGYSLDQIYEVIAANRNLNELGESGLDNTKKLADLNTKILIQENKSIDNLIKENDLRVQQEKIDADISVQRADIIKKEIEDGKKIQGAPGQDIEQIREETIDKGIKVAAEGALKISGILGAVSAITTTISTGAKFIEALGNAGDALSAVQTENMPSGKTGDLDDGIIEFNPRDKFTKVQVVAGTHEGGNKALAKQLANNANGSGDANAVIKALNSMQVIVKNQFSGRDLMTLIEFTKANSSNVMGV